MRCFMSYLCQMASDSQSIKSGAKDFLVVNCDAGKSCELSTFYFVLVWEVPTPTISKKPRVFFVQACGIDARIKRTSKIVHKTSNLLNENEDGKWVDQS